MAPMIKPELEDIKNICWGCGKDVEVILDSNYPDRRWFKCATCEGDIDRLADIESDYTELKKQYQTITERYERIIENIKNILT